MADTLQSSKHLETRVSKINFNITVRELRNNWDRRGYFKKLTDCCPNVKVVTAKSSCHWLWTHLLTQQHKWKNLQEIPRPVYDHDMEMYAKTALEFNDRLTNLVLILYSRAYIYFSSPRHGRTNLLSFLSTFKCLKHLEINRTDDLKLE